jgi:hypothetical protein
MSKLIISKSFFIIITVLGCISLIATTIIYLILTFFTSGQGGVKFGTLEFIFTIIYAVFPFCLFVGVVVKIIGKDFMASMFVLVCLFSPALFPAIALSLNQVLINIESASRKEKNSNDQDKLKSLCKIENVKPVKNTNYSTNYQPYSNQPSVELVFDIQSEPVRAEFSAEGKCVLSQKLVMDVYVDGIMLPKKISYTVVSYVYNYSGGYYSEDKSTELRNKQFDLDNFFLERIKQRDVVTKFNYITKDNPLIAINIYQNSLTPGPNSLNITFLIDEIGQSAYQVEAENKSVEELFQLKNINEIKINNSQTKLVLTRFRLTKQNTRYEEYKMVLEKNSTGEFEIKSSYFNTSGKYTIDE